MKDATSVFRRRSNRRRFLQNGMIAAGAATMGAGLMSGRLSAFGRERDSDDGPPITQGDIHILQFLSALEQIEEDLWRQYSELGGIQDSEISGANGGNALYQAALQILDADMSQYVHDNTDDEISHHRFLNNYLASKGAKTVDLRPKFAKLPSSKADGALQIGRLTNLTQLTVDTSFWSRYRSITNPDFDPNAPFVQAVPSLNVKGSQHTAIPRTNQDTKNSTITANNAQSISTHLQAIAFTAGFHFAFIEQGGTSLYPTLALKASNLEVLRILLSIGPSETMHFQTWQDKAGNALPLSDTDTGFPGSTGATVTFTDLTKAQGEEVPESVAGDTLQANLIMPEPIHFLDADDLGPVAIIRPTSTKFSGAVAAVQAFIDDGLFIGQPKEFTDTLFEMADKADNAKREF